MPATARSLHQAVAAVCPIHGVAIGNPDDKNTWRIDYHSNATFAQQQAAKLVLQGFNRSTPR